MSESDALREVTRLFAAFPSKLNNEDTIKAYAEHLVGKRSVEALHTAIDNLIRSEKWLPSVASILEEYERVYPQFAPLALPEPELTHEEKLENARQAKLLRDRLRRGLLK